MIGHQPGPRGMRPGETGSARTPAVLLTALTAAAGLAAGLAAASGSGPFAGLRPHPATRLVRSQVVARAIPADTLFPPPRQAVVQKTVDVYDPPAPARAAAAAPAAPRMAPPTDEPQPTPSAAPSPHPHPSPSPPPDDGGD